MQAAIKFSRLFESCGFGLGAEIADDWHRRLLRLRSTRQNCRGNADQREELAPSHVAVPKASGACLAQSLKSNTFRLSGGVEWHQVSESACDLMSALGHKRTLPCKRPCRRSQPARSACR